MDSPEPLKTHYVRCLKCGEILECSRYDTNALLEHIRTNHTEVEIVENGMPLNGHTTIREAAGKIVAPNDTNNTDVKNATMFERGDAGKRSEDYKDFQPPSTSSRERLHIRSHKGLFQIPVDGSQRDLSNCDQSNGTSAVYTRRYQVNIPSPPAYDEKPSRSLYRTSIEKWRPANGTIYCPKCGVNRRPLIRTQAERSSNNSCCAACILGCWPFCFLPFLLPNDNKEYLHCSNCKAFLGLYDRTNNCVRPNREYCQTDETVIKETDMRLEDDDGKDKRNCRCA
ncbi:uncharacterized protein LOC101448421 isoform X1 [Ceratitis capitata]|uniref:uncharacterized protein LOC101448421 isoform X1 n=1 Tax=Ceratitis capitata TaxID=7213 RepID=UPI0006188E16|nr:uncharacterized protein LOC101448421 isoform X1 [Ceratitis capitata]